MQKEREISKRIGTKVPWFAYVVAFRTKLFKIILKITVICSSRTPLLISHERQEHNVRNEYKIEKKYTVK